MANRTICPECGCEFQPEYVGDIVFDKFFSRLLITVVRKSKTGALSWKIQTEGESSTETEFIKNYFLASSLNDKNLSSRVHDLKCWGLLEQRREWYHQGIYTITPKTVLFLRGEISIERSITVNKRTQKIIRSEGTTTFLDALKDREPGWEDFLNDWLRSIDPVAIEDYLQMELPF